MNELTPREIVEELNKHIIGQEKAKRSVAIAMRNRWRRMQLDEKFRTEVTPKNILMIGPTGVGKTEIARRLAKLTDAPFLKVEATKFTEVGYVGKEVDSIIKDLANVAMKMLKEKQQKKHLKEATEKAEKKVVKAIIKCFSKDSLHSKDITNQDEKEIKDGPENVKIIEGTSEGFSELSSVITAPSVEEQTMSDEEQEVLNDLRKGIYDEKVIKITPPASETSHVQIMSAPGLEDMTTQLEELFGQIKMGGSKPVNIKVKEAMKMLIDDEASKLINENDLRRELISLVENHGIIFIDEIDKICETKSENESRVSREGVQRDLLPLIEGCAIRTKYGMIKTDHILFITSGAFQLSKPSDLIPELQGRLPIRVELQPLTADDFARILVEPHASLTEQTKQLMATEGVDVSFTNDGIRAIAEAAYSVNNTTENIGARRLHTIMEKLFEDISFNAPDVAERNFVIDKKYVSEHLDNLVDNEDISRYIL